MTRYYALDLIRAFSILLVFGYHFHVFGFENGFLGVDIFFFLSGYLINLKFEKSIASNGYSFFAYIGEFISKRILRLYPPLIIIVIFSLLLSYLFFLPFDEENVRASSLFSMIGLSNYYFFTQGGYFSSANDVKLLLHLWSLSAEIQFYVFFIIFVTFSLLIPNRGYVPVLWLMIFSVSFCLDLYLTKVSSNLSFFFSPSRFWEFSIGALLVYSQKLNLPSLKVRNTLLDIMIIALLSLAFFLAEDRHSFWFFLGIFMIGYLTLIHDLHSRVLITLSVFFAKRAYFMYLLHWPILCMVNYLLLDGAITSLLIIGLSILLSNWEPIYARNRLKGAVGLAVSLAVLTAVWLAMPLRVDQKNISLWNGIAKSQGSHFRCPSTDLEVYTDYVTCLIGDGSQTSIILFGDSHSQMYGYAATRYFEETGISTLIIRANGCPPTLVVYAREDCLNAASGILTFASQKTAELGALALVGFHLPKPDFWLKDGHPNKELDHVDFYTGLGETLERFGFSTTSTFLIQPGFYADFNYPFNIARSGWVGQPVTFLERLLKREHSILPHYTHYMTVDFLKSICPAENSCDLILDNKSMLSDSNHLSFEATDVFYTDYKLVLDSLLQNSGKLSDR